MRTILLAATLALAAAACGSSGGECDKACRNYFTLHYWSEWDPKIAAAPPDKRDAVRQEAVDKLDTRMTGELGKCVVDCRQASSDTETKCMIEAKTVKDIEACVPPGQE